MKTLGIAAASSIAFTASLLPFGGESYAATNAHVGAAQSELLAKGGASQPEFFCTMPWTRSWRIMCGTEYRRVWRSWF